MRIQSLTPEDTLFGRAVNESGFATPLVVLGFATLWLLPVLASVAGGDVFASEDRDGTWATLFTRSRSRAEVFAGKLLVEHDSWLVGSARLPLCPYAVHQVGVDSDQVLTTTFLDLLGQFLRSTGRKEGRVHGDNFPTGRLLGSPLLPRRHVLDSLFEPSGKKGLKLTVVRHARSTATG